MQNFNSSISKLDTLKDDATNAISEIENAEKEEKILSRDITLIKQEQENTKIDRRNLEIAHKYTHIFSFIVLAGLSTAIILLSSFSLFKNQSVLMPLTILCFLLILAIALIYLIKRKIKFELILNGKKQAKLMTMLNKKTVVYSYYLNFLNFAYSKYKVKNVKTLKTNLEKYPSYKNIVYRYDKLGKILEETQDTLEKFINEKNIKIKNASVETFAKSINIENIISYSKSIEAKKLIAKQKFENIDKDFNEIQIELATLNDNDTTKENIIARIISYYLKELEYIDKNFIEDLNEEDDNLEEKLDDLDENIDNN